jgi:hypothetical protein
LGYLEYFSPQPKQNRITKLKIKRKMNNNVTSAGTEVDSSTKDELLPSAPLAANPMVSAVIRFFYPKYSSCEKCGLTWNLCKSKSVQTTERDGTFATCDKCWKQSTLSELKRYYTKVYKMQERSLRFTEYKMEHSLEHLLNCVEQEYDRTNSS